MSLYSKAGRWGRERLKIKGIVRLRAGLMQPTGEQAARSLTLEG